MEVSSEPAQTAGAVAAILAGSEPRSSEELAPLIAGATHDQRSLADILVEAGVVAEDVACVLDDLPISHLRSILTDQLDLAEDDVQRAFARALGLPFVDPTVFEVERTAINAIPAAIARRHNLMPLCYGGGALIIASEDPENPAARETLALNTQHTVEYAVATRSSIERAITSWYGPEDDREAFDEIKQFYKIEGDAADLELDPSNLGSEKPVVRLVHNILLDAIHYRASDVHIKPLEERVDLLFRLDGALVKMRSFPKSMLAAVVSRIKIIGNMNIAEHRLPQDGRFRITANEEDIDLRLSVIPMVQGESVVIRILNVNAGLKSIDELGFSEADAERFTELTNRSTGMILVTGPTGCGKSTTLYAALQEVKSRDVNIVTVEDPVENRVEGINQIQVNSATGLTFARALRHILRHDPDVVMVGEIRDQETAKMAVESSLTGHLVLSTLHTNDAASAITRMLEIGIEPYLVKSSLIAVLAQRLVRVNCPGCIEVEAADEYVLKSLGVSADEKFFKGVGCLRCHGTGYQGRRAVYELLSISNSVRELIDAGASSVDIERCAVREGMQSLTQNALAVARTADTSLAEVYRVRLT